MPLQIKLPKLGDGIESGDVLSIQVKVGDRIAKNQTLVELETDKATVEIPSSHAGKVTHLHVQEGQTIPIGGTLITLEPDDVVAAPASKPAVSKPAAPKPAAAPPPARPVPPAAAVPAPAPKPTPAPKPVPTAKPAPAAPPPVPVSPAAVTPAALAVATMAAPVEAESPSTGLVAAGPAVRRFAREVGVDLHRVSGTGVGGRIVREDVLRAVRQANEVVSTVAAAQAAKPPEKEAGPKDAWGPIRLERITKIRKTIAARMHESWSTVPRVTNFDDADVTELEQVRQASKADYAARGIKLTAMPFVIKAVSLALKQHAAINASIDLDNDQIIYKEYVNIGIAVDTDRGLVVPSLRAADTQSIPEIARNLATMADNVRDNNFSVDDLRGGTFTISNLGAIGGTYATPIVNVPEVAILLIGRSREMPIVLNGGIAIRLMMPLSLSYDHRLVDGATAARFLNDVISYLEAPSRLLLAP